MTAHDRDANAGPPAPAADTQTLAQDVQQPVAQGSPPSAPALSAADSAAEVEAPSSATPRWIPSEVLRTRLALRSHSAVDEIYQIAQQQLHDEDTRDSVLTAKANTTLGAAGLSTTLAFSFGAFLLEHPGLMNGSYSLTVVLFVLAIVCGLLASLFALFALGIAGYEYVNEAAVFNEDNFHDLEEAFDAGWNGHPDNREDAADRAALSLFRRYLIAHLWGIYQRTHPKLERKAEKVKCAQRLYIAFLVTILVLALTVSAVAFARRSSVVALPANASSIPVLSNLGDARLAAHHDAAVHAHDGGGAAARGVSSTRP